MKPPELGSSASNAHGIAEGLFREYFATHPLVEQIVQQRTKDLRRALAALPPAEPDAGSNEASERSPEDLHVQLLRVPDLSSSTTGTTASSLSSPSIGVPEIPPDDVVTIIDEDRPVRKPDKGHVVGGVPTALFGRPDPNIGPRRQQSADDEPTDETVIYSPREGIVREVPRRLRPATIRWSRD